MKLFFKIIFIICFFIFVHSIADAVVLKGYIEKVPDVFWGSWRVVSTLKSTDSPITFKTKGLDLWNLSQENNVIKLSNPFSGASADITLNEVSGNLITFTKISKYDNKIVTDSVNILIDENEFVGVDTIKLDSLSDIDGSIKKTETAVYSVKGEKISGQSINN